MKIDESTEKIILDNRLSGMKLEEIAEEVGVSKSAVSDVCRRNGVTFDVIRKRYVSHDFLPKQYEVDGYNVYNMRTGEMAHFDISKMIILLDIVDRLNSRYFNHIVGKPTNNWPSNIKRWILIFYPDGKRVTVKRAL